MSGQQKIVYTTKPQFMLYPRIESKSSAPKINGRMLFSTPYNALNVIQSIAHFAIDFKAALVGSAIGFAIPVYHYLANKAVPKYTQTEIEQEHFGQIMMIDQKVSDYNTKEPNPQKHVGNDVDGFSTYLFTKAVLPTVAFASSYFAPPLCHLVTFIGTSKNAYNFGQACVKLVAPPKTK